MRPMRLRPTSFPSSCRIALAILACAAISGSAAADSASDCTIGCSPFSDYLEPLKEYADATGSHFLTGFNGVITAPADPVMGVVTVPKEYETLPVSSVSGRFFGMIQGSVMAAYRTGMGVLDMVLAPIPIAILSPEPRYQPIPGFEWED